MKKKLYAETRKPLAIHALSAYMAIAVYDIDYIEDTVLTAATLSEETEVKRTKLTWCKIRYDKNGEAFFKKFGRRYFFNEMIQNASAALPY